MSVERIDADAVCEQCGTVNPEETLLCKTCGNNLRDQRARRVQGDHGLEVRAAEAKKFGLLRIAIPLVGILIVVVAALKIDKIADWMVGAQQINTTNEINQYWTGPGSSEWDTMLAELKANPISQDQAMKAIAQPASPKESPAGRYVLVESSPLGKATIGQARVQMDGTTLLFVAVLDLNQAEFRGAAYSEGTGRFAVRETAGFRLNNGYYSIAGFAQQNATGGYECSGYSNMTEEAHSILAYPVP